jgi:hypothetical protein
MRPGSPNLVANVQRVTACVRRAGHWLYDCENMVLAATAALPIQFPTSPHIASPGGEVVGYYTDPPGVVMQFAHAVKGTEELARWLLVPAVQQIFTRFPGNNEIVFVMDLSMMTGREMGARALLIQHAPGMRHRFSRLFILPPLIAPPFYAGTLNTAAALLRTMSVNVDIVPSLEHIFQLLGLRVLRR